MRLANWLDRKTLSAAPNPAESELRTPLTRLPPELRDQIYHYLVQTRPVHTCCFIETESSSRKTPPSIFLVSRAFHAEAREYLFEYHTFTISFSGIKESERCKSRRAMKKLASHRLSTVKDVLVHARRLHILISLRGPVMETTTLVSSLLNWIVIVLARRPEAVSTLQLEIKAHSLWSSKPGYMSLWKRRKYPQYQCDCFLDAAQNLRCLNMEKIEMGECCGAVSDEARKRLLQAHKPLGRQRPRGSTFLRDLFGQKAESAALEQALRLYLAASLTGFLHYGWAIRARLWEPVVRPLESRRALAMLVVLLRGFEILGGKVHSPPGRAIADMTVRSSKLGTRSCDRGNPALLLSQLRPAQASFEAVVYIMFVCSWTDLLVSPARKLQRIRTMSNRLQIA